MKSIVALPFSDRSLLTSATFIVDTNREARDERHNSSTIRPPFSGFTPELIKRVTDPKS